MTNMPKYSELREDQKKAYDNLFNALLSSKAADKQAFEMFGLKLLLLGNGGSILTLISFVKDIDTFINEPCFVYASIIFIIGVILGGAVFIPLMIVTRDAHVHTINTIQQIINDELLIETASGYGLNKIGQVIFNICYMSSLISLLVGLILCISALISML
jgi:hypothetical protein